jgi:ABC-2 type transport system ATP-binding protein
MTLSIEARHLGKRFGPVTAVDDVSFEVAPGRVTGFLGPNGAGKTTTLRMLLGLVTPASGTAAIGGRPYRELGCPLRQVGVVLESSGAHPGRTARNHLRLHVPWPARRASRPPRWCPRVAATSSR